MANVAQITETPVAEKKDWSISLDKVIEGIKSLDSEPTYCEDYHAGEWFIDLRIGSCGVFISFNDFDVRDAYGRLTKEEWPYECRNFTPVEVYGMFWEAREYIEYHYHNSNTEEKVLTVYPQKSLA